MNRKKVSSKQFIARFVFLLLTAYSSLLTPAFAAITEVAARSNRCSNSGAADTLDCAFAGNVTTGNLLIVGGLLYGSGGNINAITITDSLSTSYTVLAVVFGTNYVRFIGYGMAPSSGANTVTVDPDANSYMSFAIDEFTGVDSTPLDVDGGSTSGSGTSVSGSITTATDNALIIGLFTDDSGNTGAITETGGLTKIGEQEDGGCCIRMAAGFKIATTAGAYTATWTLADSVTAWEVYLASFKPFVGGGGGGGRRRLNSQAMAVP